jgi:GAF domain-containing protein
VTESSVSSVLSAATAAMVAADGDVADGLATLLAGARDVLDAEAVALLVRFEGSLELLSATSHRPADLRIHEAQTSEGPCVEAIESGADVVLTGSDAIRERWPAVGPLVVDAGYQTVWAVPLVWHGEPFGGLNVFHRDPVPVPARQAAIARALADAATMLLVTSRLDEGRLAANLRPALEARAAVEQAKGALAFVRSEDMETAYRSLREIADGEDFALGSAARAVLERARRGTLR